MEDFIIEQIFEAVKTVTGVNREDITSSRRISELYYARMITTYQLDARGYSVGQICPLVGCITRGAVYHQLKSYKEEKTPYFRKCAKKVEQLLNTP